MNEQFSKIIYSQTLHLKFVLFYGIVLIPAGQKKIISFAIQMEKLDLCETNQLLSNSLGTSLSSQSPFAVISFN